MEHHFQEYLSMRLLPGLGGLEASWLHSFCIIEKPSLSWALRETRRPDENRPGLSVENVWTSPTTTDHGASTSGPTGRSCKLVRRHELAGCLSEFGCLLAL